MVQTKSQAESTADQGTPIQLVRLPVQKLEIPIEGETPLIVHRWSEKARKAIYEGKRTVRTKSARDPEADFNAARYRLADGRDGFPAVAFKAAMVSAGRLYPNITMTSLRQMFFVEGEGPEQLVPIDGQISMREDMVRVGQGTDIRWRPQFEPWGASLIVSFIASSLSPEAILSLVSAAGIGGVGEWRPTKSSTGIFGRFRLSEKAGIYRTV